MKNSNIAIENINSVKNPKVKAWQKLKTKKGRNEQGFFLLEGLKLIDEAFKNGQEIYSMMMDENKPMPDIFNEILGFNQKIAMYSLSTTIIEKLTDTEQPQGYFAIIKQRNITHMDLLKDNPSFLLLVDQIQDPGNLGTIIRSGDAAGIEGIILGNGTVDLYNPKVVRAAMGSMFHLPITSGRLDSILPTLKEQGFHVIGTSPYATQSYFDLDFKQKIAILVGNEANGLEESRKKSVDKMVSIPMQGQAESLNVAMATTLILYERVRQNQVLIK